MRANPKGWIPFAFATALALLGMAWVGRGLAHPGLAYRPWAFSHEAWSDLLAMHGDRYLGGAHPIPYLRDPIEYPVLLGLALWLPALLPGGQAVFFVASCALLLAGWLAAVAWLARVPGARPLWLAATPALALYSALNWDALPIALACAALAALCAERPAKGGVFTALGASAKLFPVALAPVAAAALARRGAWRELGRGALAFAAVTLAVNLPVALLAPRGFARFFSFNAARTGEDSVWTALGLYSADGANRVALPALALVLAGSAAVAWRCAADRPRALRLGAAFAFAGWAMVNKVWSPQYAMYAFLAGALAAAPWTLFGALSAAALADYHVAFLWRARGMDEAFWRAAVVPDAFARTACFGLLCAFVAREAWRTPPAPAPAGAA